MNFLPVAITGWILRDRWVSFLQAETGMPDVNNLDLESQGNLRSYPLPFGYRGHNLLY
jgi:hypothetical protein